jgi:hypothetical protein
MPGYQLTRPDGEQVVINSVKTGTYSLDEYIERAERNGLTLGQLLDLLIDYNTGAVLFKYSDVSANFAPIDSPALTGNPTAPTQTTGDNSTSIATTAFIFNELLARAYATLASPALTGVPTTPTAPGTTNTSQIASTAMVQAALLAYPGSNLGLPAWSVVDARKGLRINSAGDNYEWAEATPTYDMVIGVI